MAMESYLEEFVCIVEMGSVSAAARALGVPRVSLSRRLGKLETSFGVQLMHRETHQQTLTKAGKELYLRARKIVSDLEQARHVVGALDGVPRGLLRVGMPPSSWIEMMLAKAYLEACPAVKIEFVNTHIHDDLVSNGIDVALRSGRIEDERLIGRKLLDIHSFVYGSPDFLKKYGEPRLELFAQYPCVLGFESDGRPVTHWPLWDGGKIEVQGSIRSNNVNTHIEGARMGLGLAMVSERLTRQWVREGELVPILPEVIGLQIPVALVWAPSEFMDPKVRAFVDVAIEVIARVVQTRDAWENQ